jgi:hypothetical protein
MKMTYNVGFYVYMAEEKLFRYISQGFANIFKYSHIFILEIWDWKCTFFSAKFQSWSQIMIKQFDSMNSVVHNIKLPVIFYQKAEV